MLDLLRLHRVVQRGPDGNQSHIPPAVQTNPSLWEDEEGVHVGAHHHCLVVHLAAAGRHVQLLAHPQVLEPDPRRNMRAEPSLVGDQCCRQHCHGHCHLLPAHSGPYQAGAAAAPEDRAAHDLQPRFLVSSFERTPKRKS